MSDALRLADRIEEANERPIVIHVAAAVELRRLHRYELAYKEWIDKTEWVQEAMQPKELGHHRADTMRQRIEALKAEVESLRAEKGVLLAALKRFDDGCVTDDSCGECRWCVAQAAIAKAEGA